MKSLQSSVRRNAMSDDEVMEMGDDVVKWAGLWL